jgi:hypothetical protein
MMLNQTADPVCRPTGSIVAHGENKARIEAVEAKCLAMPQKECPLKHSFAPGVYMREILMPARTFVIGHQHKTRHLNIVLTGRAAVMMDGELHHIVAPCTFTSEPGVRKVLYIFETMRWATIHPTAETDLKVLESELIVKSDAFRNHELEMEQLKQLMKNGGSQCPGSQ